MALVDDLSNAPEFTAPAMALRTITRLEPALRAIEQLGWELSRMDVIAQDEFSHDVLIPHPDGVHFLVLGVT